MTQEVATTSYPIINYNVTDEQIAKLREQYTGLAIRDGDKKSYEVVAKAASHMEKIRTTIEATRKALKDPALKYGKKIDAEAKRITVSLREIEDPLAETKRAVDDEAKRIKAEMDEVERKRVEAIKAAIDGMANLAISKAGDTAATLRSRLGTALDITIAPSNYKEFTERAEAVLAQTIETLSTAVEERDTFEAEQAELAQQRADQEVEQKRLDKQREEQEATNGKEEAGPVEESQDAQAQGEAQDQTDVLSSGSGQTTAKLANVFKQDSVALAEWAMDQLTVAMASIPAMKSRPGSERATDLHDKLGTIQAETVKLMEGE